ncbi:hypothetical protein BGX38DRAFT_629625 [Terfezia claveryi]|nr:hypothetical protein BGX38DRAFT_629625 [Terfezia claveryi]
MAFGDGEISKKILLLVIIVRTGEGAAHSTVQDAKKQRGANKAKQEPPNESASKCICIPKLQNKSFVKEAENSPDSKQIIKQKNRNKSKNTRNPKNEVLDARTSKPIFSSLFTNQSQLLFLCNPH